MINVEIEYCVSCNRRREALDTADRILAELGHDLDAVALTPGRGGVFRIAVDGDLVYDVKERGYDVDAIVDAVAERADAT
ncbi:SelT/SelW/SelH family protein [Haloparvum sp. AD34]